MFYEEETSITEIKQSNMFTEIKQSNINLTKTYIYIKLLNENSKQQLIDLETLQVCPVYDDFLSWLEEEIHTV
jgi:hypothetical protein